MQAHDDVLALLTGSPVKTTETGMEHLLSVYGAQQICEQASETSHTTQRKTILDELAEILHLRGRLQQMGATFSDNGELLTYGNPYASTEFQTMLRLGPMYEEQWNSFFIDNYEPPEHGGADRQLWSDLRTLKRALRNEGIVFGREHQRYSFGNSSTKLRRLCCAYDGLRIEWLTMIRSSLPALGDRQLYTLLGDSSGDEDSDSGDDAKRIEDKIVIIDGEKSSDRAGRPRMLRHRSSGVPQALGWRFSDDSTAPRRKDGWWRFSDNLESVPVWGNIERADTEDTQVVPQAASMAVNDDAKEATNIELVSKPSASRPPTPQPLMLYSPTPLQVSRTASETARLHLPTPSQHLNTQRTIPRAESITRPREENVVNNNVKPIWAREMNKDDGKTKKWGKVRRWFRHAFGRK
ncbi:uncharacterized protein J4E88_002587 [Alternaria novae-zelandiae]|uniref:uncharacterized protein n=1 Tax=Alternaria novae-zelandiae TaxID=430562 RepID=UPI0020C2B948|nr:uncharacterized protein J4E88_002587 [Alternaria novae-zelandiae]KAI4689237.1 hypothetical protein J4E88_002587 [Alternaria novae-zelandiae]